MLHIEDDTFLGECKNYDTALGVTYVRGILFTFKIM